MTRVHSFSPASGERVPGNEGRRTEPRAVRGRNACLPVAWCPRHRTIRDGQVFWLTVLPKSLRLPTAFAAVAFRETPNRLQQRPCAGFSPASLFSVPREAERTHRVH